MIQTSRASAAAGLTLALVAGLGACGKLKTKDAHEPERVRAQAKQQQAACASPGAYDKLKGRLFDAAIAQRGGDRANLDILADYSLARVEEPLVANHDAGLEVTRCTGRLILELPPGAERAFGGRRDLEAKIGYTAQAAADGSGLVYQVSGAEPIISSLAAFNLTAQAYRPPPAIDEAEAAPKISAPSQIARADVPEQTAPVPASAAAPQPRPALPSIAVRTHAAAPPVPARTRAAPPAAAAPTRVALGPRAEEADEDGAPTRPPSGGGTGASAIRAFYGALGAGDGARASANVIPEKRASRAFSPSAMSRFYGHLAEPVRLTGVSPVGGDAYRVTYRYSTGRARCNGNAVVRITHRDGQDMIQSIRALSGC